MQTTTEKSINISQPFSISSANSIHKPIVPHWLVISLRQGVETLDLRINCDGLSLLLVEEDKITRSSAQEDVLNALADIVSEVHPGPCVLALTDEDPLTVPGDVSGHQELVLEHAHVLEEDGVLIGSRGGSESVELGLQLVVPDVKKSVGSWYEALSLCTNLFFLRR